MIKNRFLYRAGWLTAVVWLVAACAPHEMSVPERRPGEPYTVDEARACYRSELARRTRDAEADAGPLTTGACRSDWERAAVSIDASLYSVDVPIEAEYGYARYRRTEGDSVVLTPMYAKLVVVKEPVSEGECCYVRYYLPDEAFAAEHDAAYYDAMLNSRPKERYDGLSIYASLDGDVLAAGRYVRGRLTRKAFLFDERRTVEENAEAIGELLGDLCVARIRYGVQTRSQGTKNPPNPVDGGGIESVVIIGIPKIPPPPDPVLPEWDPRDELGRRFKDPFPDADSDSGGSGGDGDSSSDSSDSDAPTEKPYDKNPRIEVEDERIEQMLDSIYLDCMGSTLIQSLNGVKIVVEEVDPARPDNFGGFNYGNNTITLRWREGRPVRDYVLVEELIHAFQFQRQGETEFAKNTLSNEVEAKAGWLLYQERNLKELSDGQRKRIFNTRSGYLTFYILSGYMQWGVSIYDQQFERTYRDAIDVLRQNAVYGDRNKYPDPSFPECMNYEILNDLMLNCQD